jgi:hypothetical protein
LVLPGADFADDALEEWRDAVRSGVVVPGTPAFGGLVDQALGRTLLRNPLEHVIFLEEDRKARLLRDFGKALRRDRLNVGDLTLREWMAHVVDMPKPGAGSTPDDVRLRELVEAPDGSEVLREHLAHGLVPPCWLGAMHPGSAARAVRADRRARTGRALGA